MFTRRRTFALPFVITVAASACTAGPAAQEPPTRNPPMPRAASEAGDASEGVRAHVPESGSPAAFVTAEAVNTEETIESVGTAETVETSDAVKEVGASSTRVRHRADGTCWSTTSVDCPEGVKCNPPPPRKALCANVLERVGETCRLRFPEPECRAGEACELASPPQRVTCPEALQKMPRGKIVKGPDGLCSLRQVMKCPRGATCNPPRPREVACPPEFGAIPT